jgi:hypothetical protein
VINFAFQDILGSCLAFFIFPCVLLFPGYVISWAFDLFDFKRRLILTRHILAMIVSIAIVPILVYLSWLLASFYITSFILAVFFIAYLLMIVAELKKLTQSGVTLGLWSRYQKLAFFIAAGWVSFSIMSLADLQWGDRLYNNVVSLDFATRVSVVNAITRTGVPPVNPSFFPGHHEYITSLYYFWYILCSIVDQFGGNLVDSRMALIAGDAWCGLALMSLIAWYLKFRNRITGDKAWKTALFGISLLAISGLDIIPASISMLVPRFLYGSMQLAGDIEQWNEQITAWVGSLFWAPHHVAAIIACLTGFMLFKHRLQRSWGQKIPIVFITGLAFASAAGLSIWVTLTFATFWGIWAFVLLMQKKELQLTLLMILVGLVSLIAASPFLAGIVKGGVGGSGVPLIFEVRRFYPVLPYIDWLPTTLKSVIYFTLLPVNYMMELGFFLLIGLLWLRHYRNKEMLDNPYFIPEIILLGVVVVICSFVRATVLASSNDLGWRGWLFGQFILLIWAVDIQNLDPFLRSFKSLLHNRFSLQKTRVGNFLAILMLVGLSTSIIDVALLKFWPVLVDSKTAGFPNGLSPDTQLGERTFASRLAYKFIRDELPANIVIQPNPMIADVIVPLTRIDRPSGLYGTRQIAISANAAYNVPVSLLHKNMEQVSIVFVLENVKAWDKIDLICRDYFIEALVVNDLDPLWKSLPILAQERRPLYKNQYYAIFGCGSFASFMRTPHE